MPKVGNVLVVGGNRGIGLQLVKDILTKFEPNKLFATYRTADQSKELLELAKVNPRLRTIQLDASDDKEFPKIAESIGSEGGLNLLIFNSGIYSPQTQNLETIDKEILMRHFEINAVAPLLMAKAFAPLLEKASKANASQPQGIGRAAIVNLSTIMSSFALYDVSAGAGPSYAYRSSKAALNMLTKTLSVELRDKKILAVTIHPGWVLTDMGGPNALMTVEQSSEGILNVLSNLNETQNGKLLQYDGAVMDW